MTPGAEERAEYYEKVLKFEEERSEALNDASYLSIIQRAEKRCEGKTTQQLATEAVVALTVQANLLNNMQGDLRIMRDLLVALAKESHDIGKQVEAVGQEVFHMRPKLGQAFERILASALDEQERQRRLSRSVP